MKSSPKPTAICPTVDTDCVATRILTSQAYRQLSVPDDENRALDFLAQQCLPRISVSFVEPSAIIVVRRLLRASAQTEPLPVLTHGPSEIFIRAINVSPVACSAPLSLSSEDKMLDIFI